jgi:UDP-glucose 4-epimerase
MRVLVTGAAGHLGRALLPALLADPQVESVIAFDLVEPRTNHPKLFVLTGDILGEALPPALEGVDAVIHLAFVVIGARLGRNARDRALRHAIDVGGTRRVVKSAAEAGVTRLVYASSAVVYGAWPDNPPLIDEDYPLRAMAGFTYGEHKIAVERWLDAFTPAHPNIAITRLRLAAIVGPNAWPLINALARARIYPLNAHAPVQCLWEDDAAAAILAALAGPAGTYNVAAPGARPFAMLARLDGHCALGVPYRVVDCAHACAARVSGRWGDPGWLTGLKYPIVVSTARAEEALHWRARLCVEECVRGMRRGGGAKVRALE